jgi:hypothetical protein
MRRLTAVGATSQAGQRCVPAGDRVGSGQGQGRGISENIVNNFVMRGASGIRPPCRSWAAK